MKRIIKQISDSFIQEAKSSPRMLEDLAAMEKYMSESYDGRAFVELLQNADDAKSNRVKVLLAGNTLIIANDGRPFDENDIMAICRSGASSKQRGNNIGYRGVGFKSTTIISTEVVIFSAGVYFTFSKAVCASTLGKSEDKVPTIRIPFLYESSFLSTDVIEAINHCESEGYATYFIFQNAKINKFVAELEGFNAGWLLFLKNISMVDIKCGPYKTKCEIKRKKLSDTDSQISIVGTKNHWYIITQDNVSLAFKYDPLIGILPCEADDAVFHCFLPTIDKTGFPFKVNADFSTDPSRKHIIQDESTITALNSLQIVFAGFIDRIMRNNNEKLYPALALVNTHTTLNTIVNELENGILNRLRTKAWVPLNSNQFVKPETARIFPKWMEFSDKELVVKMISALSVATVNINMLKTVEKVEQILSKLGAMEISEAELADIMTDADNIRQLPTEFIGKVFVYGNRARFSDKEWMNRLLMPLKDDIILLSDTTAETELDQNFLSVLNNLLNKKEIESLAILYPVFSILQKQKKTSLKSLKKHGLSTDAMDKSSTLAINKWKTPVQNCMAIETLSGNSVKDVSKKNDGFSVISTDSNGNEFYIAVKSIGVIGDSFSLSESEYEAAQHYGEYYKVCLITTATSNVKYQVIINPANTIKMTKIVKSWEWISDCTQDSNGDTDYESCVAISNTDFDNMTGDQFEVLCAQLLLKNGFEDISLTKSSGDQGIDIIAYRYGIKHGIQCKCYSSDIGNRAIQEAFAGKSYYKCHVGIVLTNRGFTVSAIQLAEKNGVVLWDRNVLIQLLKE